MLLFIDHSFQTHLICIVCVRYVKGLLSKLLITRMFDKPASFRYVADDKLASTPGVAIVISIKSGLVVTP